jgi:hypothetical protein
MNLHKPPADPSTQERHNPLIGRTKTDHRKQRFYLAVLFGVLSTFVGIVVVSSRRLPFVL